MKFAVRNLFRNPRRTLLIFFTIALGTGSLFLFHGFNAGIMNQYRENTVHSRYGHGQVNTLGYRDQVHEKPWEHWISQWPQVRDRLSKVQGVRYLFPRVEFFSLLTNGRITVSGRGQGVDGKNEAEFFTTLNVESGETLSSQADGILLGRGLARALDAKPGDRVTLLVNTVHGSMNGGDFTVTGIFHTGSKDFDDVVFRVQLDQAQLLLDTDRVESIAVGLEPGSPRQADADWLQVEKVVKSEFSGLESTPFAVLDKVYYQHSVDWLKSQFDVFQMIILSIVLLGIFNTVSVGVLERKQEIGNLRANGESSGEVMALLALEGIAVGVIGAAFGIIGAWIFNQTLLANGITMPPAPGITRQFNVLIELQWAMAAFAFCMGIVTALAGTVLAAWKVARMPIGDALRST